MSVTSVLVSGIGVWFSLAVSSAIGEEAMGIFQLILSVVSFGSTFACSGIQLAAARLTAKKLGEGKEGALGSVMRRCFAYGGSFGTAGCLLLLALAHPIATYCLHNPVTALPLQVAGTTSFHLGNIMCALSGILLGPWLGGLAAGMAAQRFVADVNIPVFIGMGRCFDAMFMYRPERHHRVFRRGKGCPFHIIDAVALRKQRKFPLHMPVPLRAHVVFHRKNFARHR